MFEYNVRHRHSFAVCAGLGFDLIRLAERYVSKAIDVPNSPRSIIIDVTSVLYVPFWYSIARIA